MNKSAVALILLFGRNGLITRYVLHTDWNIYGSTGIIVADDTKWERLSQDGDLWS